MHVITSLKPAAMLGLFCILPLGCTHYEYDLTRPAELATHISTKTDTVVARDPLEYRLIAYEDHLIMRIYNPTDDPIELLGSQSSVVDSHGQSHPFRGQSIASHSFIKLIFPPLRPHLEHEGPSIGLGLGFIVNANEQQRPADSSIERSSQPRYFDVVADDAVYWDWDGESEVRMSLSFERVAQRFTQEFVFHRVKI